jgi:DNA-binding CsgD family transcriptional regulator
MGRYVFAALGVVLVAGWLLSSWAGTGVLFGYLMALIRMAVFPAALATSLVFYLRSRRLDDVAWRTKLSSLGLAYVALFICLIALSILWSRLSAVSRPLPLVLDAIFELAYNVVAVAWVIRLTTVLGRTSVVPAPSAVPSFDRARLLAEHGITRREAQIIELICLGKTNQEIANQLFISLTTVKDHNYVAFQKLGVRNRTELTRLVLGGPRPQPK